MKTHHEYLLNDPGLGHLALPETTAASLLAPLFEAESPSLVAHSEAVSIRGAYHELPKLLFLGERGGGVPIRVGIFAGLDAGRIETVAAVARLILQLELSPALARDYAVFAYPIVNAPGFSPDRVSHVVLQGRWAKNRGDEDARFFHGELERSAHHIVIQLRSSGVNTTFSATTRSDLLAHEVVAPALRSLSPIVPVAPDPVRVLADSAQARHADYAAGRLIPNPARQPWPFEVELYAPAAAQLERRAVALYLATLQILRGYRRFIAHGGEL